jgi:hypothetical protein
MTAPIETRINIFRVDLAQAAGEIVHWRFLFALRVVYLLQRNNISRRAVVTRS